MERKLSYMPMLGEESGLHNPFVNLTAGKKRTLCTKVTGAMVCVTLLPLRILLIAISLPVGLCLAKLATLGLKDDACDPLDGPPLPAWRRAIFAPTLLLFRCYPFLLGFWRIKVKGRCASREDAPIIVANHVSGMVEGLFFLKYAKVAEKEYGENPVIGPVMKMTSAILIDRNDPQSREKTKKAIMRRCVESRWPQTLIFPEGTCTNGTAVVQFKLGAFSPGVPVQPVAFRYPRQANDPSFTHPLNSGSYLLSMLSSLANFVEVEFLPVYRPSDEEARHPKLFAAGVQRVIANALGVPMTKHAAEDVALSIAAKKLNMPMESGVVQWQLLSESLTGVTVRDAKQVLEQFRTIDKEGKGRIDFEAFASALRRRARTGSFEIKSEESSPAHEQCVFTNEELRGIFDLLDTSGNGYVDFQEYLCGVAVLNGHGNQEQVASLKWVFDSLAGDKMHFSKEQLDDLLCRAVPHLERDQLDDLFREADRNGDGQVSREEFIAFALEHREDLGLKATRLMRGLPMDMRPSESTA